MAEKVRGTKRRVVRLEPNTGTHPRDEKVGLDTLLLDCGHVILLPSANSPRSAVASGQDVFIMCGQCGPEVPSAPSVYVSGGKEDVI